MSAGGPAPAGQTVVEKIAEAYRVPGPARGVRAGDWLTIRPRHVLTHDNTAPTMEKFHAMGAERLHDPRQPVVVLDHDIQNDSAANRAKYDAIAAFAHEHEIDLYPAGSGIGHQIVVERLYALPGSFVVAADSHANMYGGVGALGTPVVRTDAAAIWATGTFWWQVPRTVRVVLEGRLPAGSTAKDVILVLCGLYHGGEVLNAAVEFGGPGVATLSVAERLTIANMTTEWGALAGWFPADETTADWLATRRKTLAERGVTPPRNHTVPQPVRPDPDARYAGEIVLDLGAVGPHVAGPDAVDRVVPLAEIAGERIPIDKAYLLSCVNARPADLAAAAEIVRGRRVASGVELYVAAASAEAQATAETEGSWQALLAAGARPLPAGCGPCIGLGAGTLGPGEVGISATNRNYKGRMGARDARCYLASPAVVAASAVAGIVTGPATEDRPRPTPAFRAFDAAATIGAPATRLPGFPAEIQGRLVWLTADDLDTDGIYGKDYTYRDDVAPATMAEVVFANYDPALAPRLRDGDILLGGRNFGIGSSREQAVTALQASGIAAVVAGSFSRTYLRNAFNNGLPCVECPALLDHVRSTFGTPTGEAETARIPGDRLAIDFAAGTIVFCGASFDFPPLDTVLQTLVVDGGLVAQVRRRLRGC